jgi:hypothetical protein
MIPSVSNTLNRTSTNMPMMPRVRGKATRIAWAILGEPNAMKVKKNRKQSDINKRLIFEETVRVR